MESAAPKRVVGRPFQKGDPRINKGGRPPAILSRLIAAELSEPTVKDSNVTKAQVIARRLVNLAEAGDIAAIKEILDRVEGKAIARTENGQPGDFDLDLDDWSIDDLRKAAAKLRRVK